MTRPPGYGAGRGHGPYRTSAVLGSLLMVSITVLFVAVLGTVSLGFATGQVSAPQVTLSTQVDIANDQIAITHRGGDLLYPTQTELLIVEESTGKQLTYAPGSSTDPLEPGDTVVVTTADGSVADWDLEPAATGFELRHGETYTIKLMDTESEALVYRTSLTTA